MIYTIGKRNADASVFDDHGETFTDFDKANQSAKRYFETLTDQSVLLKSDGCYQDDEVTAMVMENDR